VHRDRAAEHEADTEVVAVGRDVDGLVEEMTLDEKASLTAGEDLWSTVAVERVGVPKVRVTDGPNGARGPSIPGSATATAACVPCGAALGATWDVALVRRIGEMLGEEARSKACRVLLAPTVNIHRSPLAGRNFECYSEDPLLAGRLAVAFVGGVQSRDVATTVKHFVGNEAEFERMTISSAIDERTLREIYLLPFELAVREGGTLGLMTSYNRVNGEYPNNRADLLAGILRGEWGYEGFVISDWFASANTVAAAEAGLDLEMPGPRRAFGSRLADAVRRGDLDETDVDAPVRRLLEVFDRIGALDDPIEYEIESIDKPEHRALAREAAAGATVLLRNDGLLPLDLAAARSIAVIGPNGRRAQIMGGGSASLDVHYRITPLDAIRARVGDEVTLAYERGCDIDRTVPPLGGESLRRSDGRSGLDVEFFATPDLSGDAVHRGQVARSRLQFLGSPHPSLPAEGFSLRATGTLVLEETGAHTFTLVQAGRARLLVDGKTVLDGFVEPPPPGPDFFGLGSEEVSSEVELEAGRAVDVVIEYSTEGSSVVHGVKIGGRPPVPGDQIGRAETVARDADAVVLVVGTNDDWESEGHDRTSLKLPGDQDELVRRVLACNPNTVVVLNTGAPVTMPWIDDARAVLQMWFGGQEMANALVDVITGDVDPGGRLPTTFPKRLEHNPSFGNFPGENGEVRYGEGLFVGYRWYQSRRLPTEFDFGHGLSYTTFSISQPTLSSSTISPGDGVTLSFSVTNTGDRRGSEVVQCYVAPIGARVTRPESELKAFAKVHLAPGERETVELTLDDRAFAYWDPPTSAWRVDAGEYEIRIGRSASTIDHVLALTVAVPA
jgi:beta-glucosidase